MKDEKILLIEDSEFDAELAIEALCSSGYESNNIHCIKNINDIVTKCKSNNYKIIVSDYDLITFNALDVIYELERLGIRTPVICLTGAIGEEKAAALIKQGIKGYLLKENVEKLPDLIEKICDEFERELQLQKMQMEIKESENKYRSLFENLSIGVAVHELTYENDKPVDYRIIEMNKIAGEILNMDISEVVGKHASEVFNDKPPYIDIYIKAVKSKKPYSFQTYYEKMGKHFEITVYSTEPDRFITIFSDISEKINAEAQMKNIQRLESVGTLASGVAHEINNPINGILNYSQIIMDEAKINSEIYQYAQIIKKESMRIAETTSNLLQFSRYDTGQCEYVSLNKILKQTISLLETTIKKEKISLIVDLDTKIEVNCHPQQIQQIVMNLLLNAKSAVIERNEADKREMKIKISSNEFNKSGKEYIRIIVEDNGKGIPPENNEKIFAPFFTTKSRCEGTGLGLSISQKIAQAHKGNLYFESEENNYTRFYLELPKECKCADDRES